ncbi:hypothetical protein EX30DRAFT_1139 [Ascodesmis nigricans]|uniref:DUF7707 domain-containing protein n=1 Tax=Ascodesmis nigricans TaxID=341454 RepID=A0A4S2N5K6_9PEZI|nr:hypothetical protein EX30DRAFT_1139 [Ascodesmis nigricans]
MRSFIVTAAVVASSFLGAQAWDVEDIPEATREHWCKDQVAACPLLCRDVGAGAQKNDCFPDNLYYLCLCTNGVTPNSTQVIQTIPYFTCTLNQGDCVAGCGPNAECSKACKETYKCSASNPTLANITASASTSAATPSKTSTGGTCNGFACAEGTDQKNKENGAGSLSSNAGAFSGVGLLAVGIAAFIGL